MALQVAPEVENNWRYELKYRLTYQQYQQIKNAFYPYIELDPYTEVVPSHKYQVRSLYFDSLDYQSYNEKLGGNYGRFKFRIRTYSNTLENGTVIRFEIKLRHGSRTEKYSSITSVAAYCDFVRHYHFDCETDPTLIEFERNVHARILRPKVLVEYQREGFRSRGKEGVRVTFDHHVRSAQSKTLFPLHAFFREHNPHEIVLEIKHRGKPPDWLKGIVHMQGIKIVTNSKYCQGIEVTQLDLINHALRV